MKLYIDLFLSITLTGTVPFFIYLLLSRSLGTKISAAFHYKLLKLCLFCYIFPFSLLKSLLINCFMPNSSILLDEYVYLNNKIVQTTNGYQLHPQGGFYELLLPVWLIVLIIIVSYKFYRYLCFRNKILHHLAPDSIHQNEFVAQKEQLGLPHSVSLLYCDAATSPFTYGILHPCVVITSVVPEDAVPMVIRHELQHIKSHDFLFRAAAFLVVLLHCWNPFIFLLWKEFCEIQEMACDEKITAALSPNEVRLYGYSMIDIVTSIHQPLSYTIQLSQNNKKVFAVGSPV